MNLDDNDENVNLMKQVFDLALKGRGAVSPNPLVGALLSQKGRVVGRGFHSKAGQPHAEIEAIRDAQGKGIDLVGSTLYCNLEPCCHVRKLTPPCVPEIIKARISKVVIANCDPNPEVNGQGTKALLEAGIEVVTGVLEEQGAQINEFFFKFIRTQKPFVLLKMGQSLDGKIATCAGDSKYITGETSLLRVHRERQAHDAILIGTGTFLADNPRLTVRTPELASVLQPWRIVLCRLEKLRFDFHLLADEHRHRTLVVTTEKNSQQYSEIIKRLRDLHIDHLGLPENAVGNVDLGELLREMGLRKITSVIVEGGSNIYTQFLAEKLYDKVSIFIAPLVIGSGQSGVGDLKIHELKQAVRFERTEFIKMGRDVLFTGYKSEV